MDSMLKGIQPTNRCPKKSKAGKLKVTKMNQITNPVIMLAQDTKKVKK